MDAGKQGDAWRVLGIASGRCEPNDSRKAFSKDGVRIGIKNDQDIGVIGT